MSIRSTRHTLESIVGDSDAIQSLRKEALKAAATQFPVLITGERAHRQGALCQGIHHASARRLYPFVRINCSAIPKDLLESELFGYEKGAFTGARSAQVGQTRTRETTGPCSWTRSGSPSPDAAQTASLIEDKEFERIGGTSVLRSDFSSHRRNQPDLEDMLAERRFRKDLFLPVNVIPLHIPPLRERREDILRR